jgi:hypothetical protein
VPAFDAPMPANTLGKAFDLERRGRNIEPFVEGAAVLKSLSGLPLAPSRG